MSSECTSPAKVPTSEAEDRTLRRKTCRFIQEAGRVLKLGRVATATAMVFFHRFFSHHKFSEHDRFEVAVACVLLAAKTEETPRKLPHVIQECNRLKNPTNAIMDTKSDEYIQQKERILLLERVVLHTINFDLSIEHPDTYVFDTVLKMGKSRQVEYEPSAETSGKDRSKLQQVLMQNSINFVNDSMCTHLCLKYSAKDIAMACIYLGGKFTKIRPVNDVTWMDALGISLETLVGKFCCNMCLRHTHASSYV